MPEAEACWICRRSFGSVAAVENDRRQYTAYPTYEMSLGVTICDSCYHDVKALRGGNAWQLSDLMDGCAKVRRAWEEKILERPPAPEPQPPASGASPEAMPAEVKENNPVDVPIPGLLSMNEILRRRGLIHLQGIGNVRAIPARELKPGMLLSWNYSPNGYEVASVREVSPNFIEIVERNRESGKETPRRLKKDRLVAAEAPKLKPVTAAR